MVQKQSSGIFFPENVFASQRIYLKVVRTYASFKNYWGTKDQSRHKCIPCDAKGHASNCVIIIVTESGIVASKKVLPKGGT